MSLKIWTKTLQLFSDHQCSLTEEEKADLQNRLKTKSYYLYKLAIAFVKDCNLTINYTNVKNLIKLEIRIRNEVRNFITACEEAIWNQYILKLEQNQKEINLKTISKNTNLNQAIEFLDLTQLNKNRLNKIRMIRNDVSHLVYFIMFGKMEKLIIDLLEIQKLDFVVTNKIKKTINKMKNDQKELGFGNLNIGIPNKIL